eukprot:g5993.t1
MASITTNPPHAKRQRRTTLKPATIEGLKQKRAPPPIKIGILVLPAGFESACGILLKILLYLDIKTLCNVKRSSLIQQCRKAFGSDDFERVRDIALSLTYEGRRSINEILLTHPAKRLYLLIERYKREFPRGTPIVCACEHGHDMTLKEYVNQVGKSRGAYSRTPLMAAARYEHFQLVKYLIEQGEADPNIANSDGNNALHWAADENGTNTELIELLLTHMSLDSINKKNRWGSTPLDDAYRHNRSPIRQEIIALLRSKGGKANCFDENGRYVGYGNAFGSDDFERVRDIALSIDYEGRRSINEILLTHSARRLYLLIERYKREFPRGTPIVCACRHGRIDDVELFMSLHPFHKYITNCDVNGYRDDMTLKDMVSQVGRNSVGNDRTPLMAAAWGEHFQVVKYLIEQGEADPNIANKIIALLRLKGGKANYHDANGRDVGRGNGDLNIIKTGEER